MNNLGLKYIMIYMDLSILTQPKVPCSPFQVLMAFHYDLNLRKIEKLKIEYALE